MTVVAILAAACSSGGDDEASTATSPPARAGGEGALEWSECGEIECATLTVPLDHDRPGTETIDLALARRPADGEAIGVLMTNPGGPGVPGKPLVANADAYFGASLLERFDIVSWDPRGVGDSTAVDCVDNLDFFYATDMSPDDQAEVDAALANAQRLVAGCEERSGDLLPYLSTRATVRDMDLIREALGEEQISYLGFSYGTYIGALYAEAFPDRVRAMVLDGAVDPSLSFEQLSIDQAEGFDAALGAFLDDCARRDCDFGGDDPRASFESLMQAIDDEEQFARVAGEERALGPGEADLGVANALYAGEIGWGALEEALRTAAQGDGSNLLELADAYTGRRPGGEYSNQTEAFYAIGCLDAPAVGRDDLARVAGEVAVAAPYFGASTTWLSAPCAVWPVPAVAQPAPVRAPGAPPILVIGTSNDPATPLRWAEGLAGQLESGVLLVYEGEGHTAYARGSECIDGAVDTYLLDLDPPPDSTRC